jgi:hypothetical protein
LTSTYGRSNRISKLVNPMTKQPVKNLDGFLGLKKDELPLREEERPKADLVEEIPQPVFVPVAVVEEQEQDHEDS